MVFVNLSYQRLDIALDGGDKIVFDKAIDMSGFAILNVESITSIAGNWSIDEDGNIAGKSVTVEQGVNFKDQATGDYYCVTIVNGEFSKVNGKCGTTSQQTASQQLPKAVQLQQHQLLAAEEEFLL